MKCPKCGYIGYDSGDRCRNCGYEFSLAIPDPPALTLPIQTDDPIGPLDDLLLRHSRKGKTGTGRPTAGRIELDRAMATPSSSRELPLFRGAPAADPHAPLVTPSPPRPPLAVRRATPPPPRARPRAMPRSADLDLVMETVPLDESSTFARDPVIEPEPARPLARAIAALVDAAILAAIDVAVVYFTLRLCRLTPEEIGILPVPPLLAFLLLLNGGYLTAFTATNGQTIGKMAMGIRVIVGRGERVPLGRSALRALAMLLSLMPVGLGFVPALIGERRALHDWLARTRVIEVDS